MSDSHLAVAIVNAERALRRGDEETAYSIYYPVCAIVSLQLQAGLDGFLAIEKHLMVKRGLFPTARRRRPYGWDLDPETAAEVDAAEFEDAEAPVEAAAEAEEASAPPQLGADRETSAQEPSAEEEAAQETKETE